MSSASLIHSYATFISVILAPNFTLFNRGYHLAILVTLTLDFTLLTIDHFIRIYHES